MMFRSNYIALLLVAIFRSSAISAERDVEFGADFNGDHTKAYTYAVSLSVWKRQPQWSPGTGPCPLSLEDATRIALKWLKRQPWETSVYLRNIILSEHPFPGSNRWHYGFLFDDRVLDETPTKDGVIRAKHPAGVIVLLDGSMVTAKKPQPQQQAPSIPQQVPLIPALK